MGGAGLQFAFRVFHLLRVALGAMSVKNNLRRSLRSFWQPVARCSRRER